MDNIDGTGITAISGDFTGNLNGNGKTIGATTALTTNLFSKIGAGGQVYNLTLNVAITDNTSEKVAGFAIENAGVIRNVSIGGTIGAANTSAQVGGLVHTNNGTLDGCTSSVVITTTGDAGGIAYINNTPDTVKYCTNTGAISARRAGGVVYSNTAAGVVSHCENTGALSGEYVAGAVFANAGAVNACANTGAIATTGELSETYNSGCIVGNGNGSIGGCTCGDDTHGHGSTVPVTVAGNRLPVPVLDTGDNAPSVPASTPAGWNNYQTGATIDDKTISGIIPFYQKHPKDGETVNANLWVVKFTLEKFVSSSAKLSLDDGNNWVAAKDGSRNLIPVGNDAFYLIGTGTTAITVKVDNNGILENDEFDRISIEFDPSGASLAQLAFGATVGEDATAAWANLDKTNPTATKSGNTVTLTGTVPFYDTELTITGDNASTLTAHNIWAFYVELDNLSTIASVVTATNCTAKIANGHLYVAGTAEKILADNDIKVTIKNNAPNHGDITLIVAKDAGLSAEAAPDPEPEP